MSSCGDAIAKAGEIDEDDDASPSENAGRRVDKWLWFVRVVKSRTMAAGLVNEGRVRVNKAKIVKPSHTVKAGDVLTITVGARLRILKVVALGERRGPPSEAMALYEDLTPPPPPKEVTALVPDSGEREPGSGRPTKRDRRLLDRLKRE